MLMIQNATDITSDGKQEQEGFTYMTHHMVLIIWMPKPKSYPPYDEHYDGPHTLPASASHSLLSQYNDDDAAFPASHSQFPPTPHRLLPLTLAASSPNTVVDGKGYCH